MIRLFLYCVAGLAIWCAPKVKAQQPSAIDQWVADESKAGPAGTGVSTPGSLWTGASMLNALASDLRASRPGDIVTIIVSERASAVATGNTKTARASSAKAKVDALTGLPRAAGPLPNLLSMSSQNQLDGQGTTSRETTLSATLAARVTHAFPNGLLVVEGIKTVTVNSEAQVIRVRGIVRAVDLSSANAVTTDRLAQMEVSVNGRGVINDSIRRPMFLYRLLLGILPF